MLDVPNPSDWLLGTLLHTPADFRSASTERPWSIRTILAPRLRWTERSDASSTWKLSLPYSISVQGIASRPCNPIADGETPYLVNFFDRIYLEHAK